VKNRQLVREREYFLNENKNNQGLLSQLSQLPEGFITNVTAVADTPEDSDILKGIYENRNTIHSGIFSFSSSNVLNFYIPCKGIFEKEVMSNFSSSLMKSFFDGTQIFEDVLDQEKASDFLSLIKSNKKEKKKFFEDFSEKLSYLHGESI
jgi:hypothetical protein